mgnify:CR=1 FL=1
MVSFKLARCSCLLCMIALLLLLIACRNSFSKQEGSAEGNTTSASVAVTVSQKDESEPIQSVENYKKTTRGKTLPSSTYSVNSKTTIEDEDEPDMLLTIFDLEKYTEKLWKGNTVYHESVCFLEEKDGNIVSGNLLYTPNKMISMRSSDLEIEYQEGKDYIVKGNRLVLTKSSRIDAMPFDEYSPAYAAGAQKDWLVSDADASRYIAVTTDILKHQVSVTYTHKDSWTGYRPPSQLAELPIIKTMLEKKQPLKIVFYGDSITAGWEASGVNERVIDMSTLNEYTLASSRSPYMPSWSEMVCEKIEKVFKTNITKINRGSGGAATPWGKTNAKKLVNSCSPDLVVIGFGMNQVMASGNSFKVDIKAIINTIKEDCPRAEFLLVSCMVPNTEAASFAGHHLADQERELYQLQDEMSNTDIAVAPVYSMSSSMLKAGKLYTDISGNNLNHPNDFSIRLYAQTILATMGV